MHAADDDGLLLPAVVLRVADVALIYSVLELLGETAAVGHVANYLIMFIDDRIIQNRIVVRSAHFVGRTAQNM